MDDRKELVQNIKILMIKNDVSNERMAELLGLNRDAWIKRLNLVVKITLEEARKIANFFNVTIEELY